MSAHEIAVLDHLHEHYGDTYRVALNPECSEVYDVRSTIDGARFQLAVVDLPNQPLEVTRVCEVEGCWRGDAVSLQMVRPWASAEVIDETGHRYYATQRCDRHMPAWTIAESLNHHRPGIMRHYRGHAAPFGPQFVTADYLPAYRETAGGDNYQALPTDDPHIWRVTLPGIEHMYRGTIQQRDDGTWATLADAIDCGRWATPGAAAIAVGAAWGEAINSLAFYA